MRFIFVTMAVMLAAESTAFGHGVQIQITYDSASQKIRTHDILSSSSGAPTLISDPKRVYVMPLLPFSGPAGDGWYSRPTNEINPVTGLPEHPTGPGLMFEYDDLLAGTGWTFSGSSSLPNLENSSFGYQYEDGLRGWDGAAFVDPGDEQLQMFAGSGTSTPSVTALTSDSGPYGNIAFGNITTKSANPHSSAGFLLYGDGSSSALSGPAAGDDGIYLAQLTVTSTVDGVGDSDSIYFVLHKNADAASALTAAESLGFNESLITVVPEPSTAGLVALAALAIIRRRRHRKCA